MQSSLPSPQTAEGGTRRAHSPEALEARSQCSAGLWGAGSAGSEQPTVDDFPAHPASHGAAHSTRQVGTSNKRDDAASPSQSGPGLTHTAPPLHETGDGVTNGHAASVGSANVRSPIELQAEAVVMQETFQGRLWAATAEPDPLSDTKADHATLRAFVHRIKEYLSCGCLEELEAEVHRMSACAIAVPVDKAAGAHTSCSGAPQHCEPSMDQVAEGAEQVSSDRCVDVASVQQGTEQLALKRALEEERAGRVSERALQTQQMHELRKQLQQAELRLEGLAEVQEMTAAELVEARAERDSALATNGEPVPPQPRTALVDAEMCTEAQICALTIDQGMCTDVRWPQSTEAAVTDAPHIVSVLHVAEPPPLHGVPRLSPSKEGHLVPGSLEAAPVTASKAAPQQPPASDVQLSEQSDVAAKSTEAFEDRFRVLCKERDVAVSRVTELEGVAEELRQRCAMLKLRAEDSERALREAWPAVKQEVENVTEKSRCDRRIMS